MTTTCETKNGLINSQKIDTTKKYYVYHLIDPTDNLPFYVGKGNGDRIYHHERAVLNGKIPNGNKLLFYKIKKVLRESLSIKYTKIKEELSSSEALQTEISEIKRYGRRNINTGILCNMTDGGDGNNGIVFGKKTREKLSKAHKGRKITWGDKISKSLKEDPNLLIERAKKISESNKGKQVSKISRWKMSQAHIGKKDSNKTIKRKSEAQKQRIYSEDELLKKRAIGKLNEKLYNRDLIEKVKLMYIFYKKPYNVYEILSQINPELTYHGVRRILKVGEFKNL